jgi:uracil-DNA glycosylase family 4
MDRCSLCPTDTNGQPCSRIVSCSGPSGRCDFLFLGAGPDKTEIRTGVPYSGLAGEEFNTLYLPLANLRRDQVAVSNATLCWDGTARIPSAKRLAACASHHLPELLDRFRPLVVVLMGGAVQTLCDKRIRLDLHHGIPQYTTLLNGSWQGWVWPSYEPALGMRDTRMMTQIMDDFRRLGDWLSGDWQPPSQPDYATDYAIAHTASDVECYIRCAIDAPRGHDGRWTPGCDTERHGGEVWSLQWSVRPHTGRLIRAGNKEAVEAFNHYLAQYRPEMSWHNAPQDLDAAERMRIDLSLARGHRDTMQEAFQLCTLPQGLKALVYRLFGVEMRSWEDTVWPASIAAMTAWLERGIEIEAQRPGVELTELTMGKCIVCGKRNKRAVCSVCGSTVNFVKREEFPNNVESILRHILRYAIGTGTGEKEKPYNPWKKLPEMMTEGLRGKVARPADWERLKEEAGEMPVLGIGNCDLEEAVQYAAGDADWELQLAGKLSELRKGKRWEVDIQDYDE